MHLVASIRPFVCVFMPSAAMSNDHHYQSKAIVCLSVCQWAFADNCEDAVDRFLIKLVKKVTVKATLNCLVTNTQVSTDYPCISGRRNPQISDRISVDIY